MIEGDDPELAEEDYDDSPWTSDERHALAWEAGERAGWEGMDEYDDFPENQETSDFLKAGP